MNDDKLKKQIGANIAAYRKSMGLTQVGLAEKLNYSDKAVSKWERASPGRSYELPANTGKVEQVMSAAVERAMKRKANKRIILGLCTLLVCFVAILLFVIFSSLDVPKSWIAFIYAIPVDAIVRLSLRSAWNDFRHNQWLVSAVMWGVLLSVFMSLLLFAEFNLWKIFLLGIPGQLAIFLAFRLRKNPKEDNNG